VLQLSKYYPPVDGGIELVALELTEGLNAAGVATDVLCAGTRVLSTRERVHPKESRAEGVVLRTGTLVTVLSTPISPRMAIELLLHRRKYEVIHLHAPNPMATAALWITRPSAHIVVHWHSDVIRQQRSMALFAPLQNWLLRRACAVIATSERYARSSAWLQPFMDKVRVVPLGTAVHRSAHSADDLAEACATLRRRFGDRPVVFALGRMVSYKGFGDLIAAAARLRSDALIVVGGGGELLEAYRRRVREEGLGQRIRFVGRLSELEVDAALEVATVFCLPSNTRAEAFGVAMLEAMAAGVPVVASDIEGSGVPWVNLDGETGFNVPVGDAVAFAAAIDRLVEDPVRRRAMGEAARRRYEERFTAERMVADTITLYRSCGARI
jgi:rhamnosyl/mannosyltransferase